MATSFASSDKTFISGVCETDGKDMGAKADGFRMLLVIDDGWAVESGGDIVNPFNRSPSEGIFGAAVGVDNDGEKGTAVLKSISMELF